MIDYWINKELPKVNAEIVFTEEAEEAIKHLWVQVGFINLLNTQATQVRIYKRF